MRSLSTREAIIAAAAALLDEGGPAAVTFRAVGQRVGLSHNAPFKLFRDKESILAAVATAELRRQARSLQASVGHADPLEELRRRLHGYIAWAIRFPARFHLTFGRWEGDHPDLGEAATDARAQLVDLVRAAQSRRQLVRGDADRLASLLLATAHGAASLALNGHLGKDGKGSADPGHLIDDLLKALRHRTTGRSGAAGGR